MKATSFLLSHMDPLMAQKPWEAQSELCKWITRLCHLRIRRHRWRAEEKRTGSKVMAALLSGGNLRGLIRLILAGWVDRCRSRRCLKARHPPIRVKTGQEFFSYSVCLRWNYLWHQKQKIHKILKLVRFELIYQNTDTFTICGRCMRVLTVSRSFVWVFHLATERRSDQPRHYALCSWLNDRDPICWMQMRSIVSAPNSTTAPLKSVSFLTKVLIDRLAPHRGGDPIVDKNEWCCRE